MDAGRSTPKHCAGVRKDGQPCQGPVLDGGAYCFTHDPTRAAARQAARQRGGHNRGAITRLRGLVPPRLLPIFDLLETALGEVHDGTLAPAQAAAMAALARAMVAVLQAGEVEQRLRELESRVPNGQAR
jgi:hypothetical protein